ncbi:hypothetical protein H257_18866 [Aphanomyces astaci]|uniref:Uncharacterized protein n=1 Tax=Aphanomyces astaci TaxID=112090 RepID=W4FBC7_APHAT|nr:hypothetical protein H257_18866 [Aphanomyces astaci]ETV64219.1 hypothetical protein H257_18866 [Aphanomyces astaci]|eukprot:XP_009846299.1 hypothetical protein H257_18866 [Aphanomyces astaci]
MVSLLGQSVVNVSSTKPGASGNNNGGAVFVKAGSGPIEVQKASLGTYPSRRVTASLEVVAISSLMLVEAPAMVAELCLFRLVLELLGVALSN